MTTKATATRIEGAAVALALRQFFHLHNLRTYAKRGDAWQAAAEAVKLGLVAEKAAQRAQYADRARAGNQEIRERKESRIKQVANLYNFLTKRNPHWRSSLVFDQILHKINSGIGDHMGTRTLQDCLAKARKQGLIAPRHRHG